MLKEISLYIHIPFCLGKCYYCDFPSFCHIDDETKNRYITILIKELESWKEKLPDYQLKSVFMGGGTPTVLPNHEMDRILNALFSGFRLKNDLEFSIEGNPGTVNKEKLAFYHSSGINRLSIGLQAWQDSLLKKIGRIHNRDTFIKNYYMAREIGFQNINIDLMFSLPDQTMGQWMETLKEVTALSPDHISAYSLKIEETTPFYQAVLEDRLKLPSEDIDRDMYHWTIDFLKSLGYEHYEISNFAKEGKSCIHNVVYWNNDEYIGIGLGAHSSFRRTRFSNTLDINDYIEGMKEKNSAEIDRVVISVEDEMAETMFLGLRLLNGICMDRFEKRFGKDLLFMYRRQITDLIEKGLLETDGKRIRLTRKGIDLSNQVFIAFLPE
ncbi:MAG: radical SAM family heme chaperone HemW [Bacillota bacterium]